MKRAWIIGIVVSVFAISITWIVTDVRLSQFVTVISLAIAMLGLNLLTGFNGQISLGHGAFMGIGAYTGADPRARPGHVVPARASIVAFVICFVVGGLLGHPGAAPARHQPGADHAGARPGVPADAQEVRVASRSGVQGINTPPDRQFNSPWDSLTNDQFRYLVQRRRRHHPVLAGLEHRPRALGPGDDVGARQPGLGGVDGRQPGPTKVVTFAISAGYAGVGGALYMMIYGYISPDQSALALSVSLLTGIVVGGLGTIAGAVIGGLFVQFLPYYSNEISQSAPGVVYGVIIILVMILAPGGVIGLLRRFGAWFAGKRGARRSGDIEAAEAAGVFPTEVDDPVPTATGL